jgi:hypothetical protein
VKLALRDRPLAEEARGNTRAALQLLRQRESDRQREPGAHDRVAAIEASRHIENVHRSATTAARPGALAVELGHDRVHRQAARDRVPVLAISRYDGVLGPERLHHADRHCLLAVAQMQEAADLLFAVELNAAILEAADAQHLAQQLETALAGDARGRDRDHGAPRGVAKGEFRTRGMARQAVAAATLEVLLLIQPGSVRRPVRRTMRILRSAALAYRGPLRTAR